MSKERLEEIKKRLVLLHSAVDVDDETKNYIFEDLKVEWLVEQVQELDVYVDINSKKIDELEQQNKRYRDALIYVLKTHLESYHDPKNMLEDIKSVVNGVLEGK